MEVGDVKTLVFEDKVMGLRVTTHVDDDLLDIEAHLSIGGGIIKEFLLSKGISLGRKKPTMRLFDNFSFITNNLVNGVEFLSRTLGVSQQDMLDFLIINGLL